MLPLCPTRSGQPLESPLQPRFLWELVGTKPGCFSLQPLSQCVPTPMSMSQQLPGARGLQKLSGETPERAAQKPLLQGRLWLSWGPFALLPPPPCLPLKSPVMSMTALQ